MHIGEIAFHVLLAFHLGVGFGGIIGFGVLIGVRRRGLRRACARDVVITMANTDSTAATMDRALPRFLPRNVPTMATIANTAPTSPKIAAMLLMIGMKLSTKPSAPNTTPTMPHTVVPCGAGDDMIGAGLIPFGAAGPPLGIGALLNSLMIFFFLLEVVGTLSSLRDRLRSRYWTKVHSCLHFEARGLRHSMSMPIMGVMSVITNPSTAEVPVRTRIWCTVPMVVCASFACLAQVSFASQQYAQDSAPYLWMIACVLVAIPSGLILLARNSYPQAVFWTACLLVVALPYDSLIALMALTSLLARRQGTKVTLRSVLAAATTTIWSQVRDALHPAEASIWHAIFSKPYTGVRYGNTMVMLVDERTIIASAVVVALIAVAIATLSGLHIRSRALARVAEAKAQSANEQVSRLRTTLDNQQLADAMAHSLSLLALNASALQAESRKLKAEAEQLGNANVAGMAGKIAGTTEDIRRQASGALDEAHSVIDMLRHPEDARLQLAANDAEASLTRDSLLQLIGDARAANMRIDTWIDVQQLGQLDESIGVIAYHVVQEGLTNVRRHAPGAPVSLQVDANPPQGVHVHVSNPTMPQSPSHMADTRKGAGLPGLAKRIQQAGGTCQYGFDQHNVFHLDVRLPWVG